MLYLYSFDNFTERHIEQYIIIPLSHQTEHAQEEKRARKRKLKEKKKLEEKLRLKSAIPGDTGPMETGRDGLFSLEKLSQVNH